MLHSRLLRYLDEVARCGSIRQAAEHLNVASSAVNRQILALEEELGTPLFQRLPKGLRLSAAGELLIAHVRQTLKEHERLQARMSDLKTSRSGEVVIATMNGLAGGILPPLVRTFCGQHPRVRVTVRSLFADAIVDAVLSGEADLGLAYNIPDDPGLATTAVFGARLGAVVAPTHPLALRSPARLADCLDFPIVLADPSMTIHHLMTAAFARAALALAPAYESNSMDFIKAMAVTGEAVTFMSWIDVAEEQREERLVYVAIQDRFLQAQSLSLVRRAKGRLHGAADLIEEDIRATLTRLQSEFTGETPASWVEPTAAEGA